MTTLIGLTPVYKPQPLPLLLMQVNQDGCHPESIEFRTSGWAATTDWDGGNWRKEGNYPAITGPGVATKVQVPDQFGVMRPDYKHVGVLVETWIYYWFNWRYCTAEYGVKDLTQVVYDANGNVKKTESKSEVEAKSENGKVYTTEDGYELAYKDVVHFDVGDGFRAGKFGYGDFIGAIVRANATVYVHVAGTLTASVKGGGVCDHPTIRAEKYIDFWSPEKPAWAD